MSRGSATTIFSVCGQLERVAAEIMIGERKVKRIALEDFPPGAPLQDDVGQPAAFAIIIKRSLLPAFDDLVADLRS